MSAIPIQELFGYINEARKNPKKFSEYVKKQMDSFIDENTLPLKPQCHYSTNEGKTAWKQAYQFLQTCKPLPALELNEGLNLAAMDHAMDMKNNNIFGHQSSNGMSFGERIERRCGESYGALAQNIGTDFDVASRNHALQTIMGLVIDDGVSNRGHRKSIFSQVYKYCGLYAVKVGDRFYTCIDFHSENLKAIEKSKNPLTGGISKPSKSPQQYKEFGNGDKDFGKDFEKEFERMKLNTNKGEDWKINKNTNPGQRYVTSKSTNSKTTTKNGQTTKVTTTLIKYSDGSTEEQVNEQTY